MHISILAGAQTQLFENLLKNKEGFELYTNSDVSEGLKEIDYTIDTNLILISDAAFIKNGQQLNITEVLEALKLLANKNTNRNLLLITKNEDLATAFDGFLMECSNARSSYVTKINSKVLIDCIFNRYSTEKPNPMQELETPNEETPISEIKSVECPTQEPVAPSEPQPQSQSKTQPKKEIKIKTKKKPVQPPIQKKSKKETLLKSKININSVVPRNKILIITGNPNSGTTSTFCNIAKILASNKLRTLMIDLDIYTKGVNMYYNILDTNAAKRNNKVGLIETLEDLELLDQNIIGVEENLYLLGTHSNCLYAKVENTVFDDVLVSDLALFSVTDYDVVMIHIPIDKLVTMPNLIKSSNNIVYCTLSTINGIATINRYLNPENYEESNVKRNIQILLKKIGFVLCNYTSTTVDYNNFQETLALWAEDDSISRPLLGYINHIDKFDNYGDTKSFINDKKILNVLYEIIQNIYRI